MEKVLQLGRQNNPVAAAKRLLRVVRSRTDSILVPFSAGKDSSVVLDLCAAIFTRVQPFYLYRIEGMEIMEQSLRRTEKRYSVKIIRLPAPDLTDIFSAAYFQPHWTACDDIERVTMPDVENYLRQETGIEWVANGKRMSDSLPRRGMLRSCGGIEFKSRRAYPIWTWNRADVLAYLRARSIPLPETFGRKEQGGLDFHVDTMRLLARDHPEDWARYLKTFPYAQAAILSADLRRKSKAQPS